MKGWLSCMKHCSFLLGNTSSGFVEALYFPKKVINLGVIQQGKIIAKNIFNCATKKDSIINAVKKIESKKIIQLSNIYMNGNT